MTEAQSRTQRTPGLPPKTRLSPYQTEIATWPWRMRVEQTKPNKPEMGLSLENS